MLYIYVKLFNILVKKNRIAKKLTYMLSFLTLYEKKKTTLCSLIKIAVFRLQIW